MTIIEARPERPEGLLDPEADVRVEPAPTKTKAPFYARDGKQLSGRWIGILTVAWIVIFSVGLALEPAPTDPDATAAIDTILALSIMTGWITMASGFLQGRRYGAGASLAAAGILTVATLGCPISGHHAGIGPWFAVQLTGSLFLLGASAAALRSTTLARR